MHACMHVLTYRYVYVYVSLGGLWRVPKGHGNVSWSCDTQEVLYLPQEPYLPFGSLLDLVWNVFVYAYTYACRCAHACIYGTYVHDNLTVRQTEMPTQWYS